MNQEKAIQEIIDRETRAWDTKDVELLMSTLHHDMVWPWPEHPNAHDPMEWVLEWGRYNLERWSKGWQTLFDTHELVHNKRVTRKIVVSKDGDGAFAVVDIDTLWRNKAGKDFHWKGRACKIYSLVKGEWKMIAQIGLLDYSALSQLI